MKKIVLCIIALFLILFFCSYRERETKQPAIRFASWGSQSETKILKELIKEYEKISGTKIDFIHIPQNYFQKIQLLFASGLEPDVIFFNNQNIKMYIKANLLEDLSSYIDTNLFYENALNCFKEGNKIYAIPRDISTLVLYYNKDIFNKKNINLKKELTDLNSWLKILIKIKSDKFYGTNFEEDILYWSYYLAANGGGILSDDKKRIIISNKNSIEAIRLYQNLVNKYHVMPTKAAIGSKTTAQMFINGELATYLGGRWMVPKFREVINFDWDIIQFPTAKENKLFLDASGWAVAKKSKNKEEAIKFVMYLSGENSLKKLAQTGLIIPANKNAAFWTIEQDKKSKPKNSHVFLTMLNMTKPTPVVENNAKINDIIREKSEKIFLGKTEPEDIFNNKTIEKLESLIK